MTSTYSLQFSSPPSLWGLYPRILAARKPAPRARGARGAAHRGAPVARARRCRAPAPLPRGLRLRRVGATLPLAYPHVLAERAAPGDAGLGALPGRAAWASCTSRNRIEQFGALDPAAGGEIACWLEGHEETPRGQQFALHTEWAHGRGPAVARALHVPRAPKRPAVGRATAFGRCRGTPSGRAPAARRAAARAARARTPMPTARCDHRSFRAPAGLGRRYGQVSGDINPIHLADVTARAFGFRAAIAHGMWSLARCAAELERRSCAPEAPRVLDVQFRQPVFLPSWLSLQQRPRRRGPTPLRAAATRRATKTHLAGSLSRAA